MGLAKIGPACANTVTEATKTTNIAATTRITTPIRDVGDSVVEGELTEPQARSPKQPGHPVVSSLGQFVGSGLGQAKRPGSLRVGGAVAIEVGKHGPSKHPAASQRCPMRPAGGLGASGPRSDLAEVPFLRRSAARPRQGARRRVGIEVIRRFQQPICETVTDAAAAG